MPTRIRPWLQLSMAALLATVVPVALECEEPEGVRPLVRVIDLDRGESSRVVLCDGRSVEVRLLDLEEERCELRGAVRRATVRVEIDGKRAELVAATYNLPQVVGAVQVDSPVTRGYTVGSSKSNVWALEKDARLRLWPAGSPWIRPGTFRYPVNQRWFASDTQMGNDPCYVNACDVPGQKQVYYHYGLDFGGAEGLVSVTAATAGVVVSRAGEIIPGDHPPQVRPRHDVVYLRDDRGWYYRYSHLKSIDESVELGEPMSLGGKIGALGKEGGSGGWSHLHFDIIMPQPSGKYGITDGYAFALQAYREERSPRMLAVARPHLVAWTREKVTLDASRSWHQAGAGHIREIEWVLTDGSRLSGPRVETRYPKPGHYTETVRVTDDTGEISYDFAVVQVFSESSPLPVPPAIHAAYFPTDGLRVGDPITFKVRTFGVRPDEGEERWDFGDGSPPATTRSDGNAHQHAPDGYAEVQHSFGTPGDFIVTVTRSNERSETATGRLWVRVKAR